VGGNAKGRIHNMHGVLALLVKKYANGQSLAFFPLMILSATLSLTNISCLQDGQVSPDGEEANNAHTMTPGSSSSLEDLETDTDETQDDAGLTDDHIQQDDENPISVETSVTPTPQVTTSGSIFATGNSDQRKPAYPVAT